MIGADLDLLDVDQDLLRDLDGLGFVGLPQDDRELVTAQAGDDIDLAEHARQRLAEALQQAIARRVTAGIVDIFELVEVH